jgi:hypothetical protein
VLFKVSTGGWITESKTDGAGTLVVGQLSAVVGVMIFFGLTPPLLFALIRILFKGRAVWAEDKHAVVQYAAMLMSVFAGWALISHLNHLAR